MPKNKIIRIPTEGLSHQDWLALRQKSIGGSDAAAIIGLNPWSTPYSVWADKTDRLPPKEDNEAMRQGRDFEDYVASRFTEATGKKARRANAVFKNPDYPFAHANIDRMIVGEDAGLECKTTSVLNLKKFKDGEYPDSYYVQCMHYMAVTGLKKWYLAVLVLNQGFYWYEINRSEEEINSLMEQEADFWEYVKTDKEPPADGFDVTTDAIKTVYADSSDGIVNLFGRENLIKEYYAQKENEKAIQSKIEEIKQTLMMDLGENETGTVGAYKVTWKPQSKWTFDHKKFAEEHTDMDLEKYFKTSSFRKFDIKENKNRR